VLGDQADNELFALVAHGGLVRMAIESDRLVETAPGRRAIEGRILHSGRIPASDAEEAVIEALRHAPVAARLSSCSALATARRAWPAPVVVTRLLPPGWSRQPGSSCLAARSQSAAGVPRSVR
jgi:hypothetical protein